MAQEPAMSIIVLLLTAMIISARPASALPDDRVYKVGDSIPLFANRVRPLNGRCEVYPYFDLPFCPPGNPITNRKKSFDEVLDGDCLTNTLYDLKFKVNKTGESLCEKHLTEDEVAKFRYAVRKGFEFQMYYNNIRLRGVIGNVERTDRWSGDSKLTYYLINHINFYPYYNENQVNDMYLMSDFNSAVDITEDVEIKVNFTYSVFWNELKDNSTDDSVPWNETSTDQYGLTTEQQRSLAIVSSFIALDVIICFWVAGLLMVNVPYLSNYMTRYSNGDVEAARQLINWEQIHGDACRCPPFSSFLGAILGVGKQLLILVCSLFIVAFRGLLYPCYPEEVFAFLLLIYCITSFFSGYTATSFHCRYTTIGWKECTFQTGVLYFVPAFITAFVVNAVPAIIYGFSDLPDFSTAVVILFIWGLATIFCLSLGGKLGHVSGSNSRANCDTSRNSREVNPQPPWYMKTPAQVFLGGLLPFISIFREMDAILASLWNEKTCGAFSTMLTSFIVVIIQTIFVGMSFTYIQFSKQGYHLWWRSLLRGGSTAIFMLIYSIYFHARADPSNFTKLLYYLGYDFCMFYALFLILGTIGFHASSFVFRRIYQSGEKYE